MSEGAKASSAPQPTSLRQRGTIEGGKTEPKGDTMKGPSLAQLQSRMEQGTVSKGTDNPNPSSEVSVWEERMSMGLLLLLYTLQGIPMGLCGSIPLILKERGAT